MSEVRVVDLKELGVNKEVFDKIYSMGEQDGRADAINELKNALYERARDKGVYASEYIAFIDCTFEQ